VVEFASGISGVTDVEVVSLRIGPEQVSRVYRRYDVTPHATVTGELGDPEVIEWLQRLLAEAGIEGQCYVWFARPDGRTSHSTPGDAWIRIASSDAKESLLELWKALPTHDFVAVDGAQERVLGITEEEHEYLAHLMTVDELLAWPGVPGGSMPVVLETYDDLVELVRGWCAWGGGEEYDFGGLAHLLGACLANLGEHALDAELDDFPGYLDAAERRMLLRLADVLRAAQANGR